eukprot:7660961-Pyramimonas_sp.AAC.1
MAKLIADAKGAKLKVETAKDAKAKASKWLDANKAEAKKSEIQVNEKMVLLTKRTRGVAPLRAPPQM